MEEIIRFIKRLGFIENGNVFIKKFKENSNYEITIDLKKGKIFYRDDEKTTIERKKDGKIQIGDTTSSHFKNNQEVNLQETFVVLECVNRLLEKGYLPEDIHIERRWKVGHGASGGKADVNVYGKNEETLFIVECKTSGSEYEKEKSKMLSDGGQLFTYLSQDRSAEYLVLYSSSFEEGELIYENIIVKIKDDIKKIEEMEQKGIKEGVTYKEAKGKEKQNLFNVWKNIYSSYYFRYGIFEEDVNAYSIELKPLKKKDLLKLKSSKGLFNKYAEILRHNNISESDRAFNKILSLLLCKIVDEEEKGDNDVLDFQVIEGEENEKLIDKLQRLFKEGMQRYLGIHDFVYYSDEDVEKNIKLFPKRTPLEKVLEIFKEIKYYTNNEFAFKDVYNKKLFTQNTEILKEVIELLQHYKFKNEHKDPFLGDFFELLLNHGVKQSEGQFFTPLPIVRFIILSLDLEEMINNKIDKFPHSPLLKTLDYSCGAGHFLIEAISEIDRINIEKGIIGKNINDWTKKYIFGIEKDDRLARTSKIACFLNGDGEANIIYGDGLKNHKELEEEKEKFDLLITNPPYSVKAFKNYIDIELNGYELFGELSDKSSQIEALFVERAKQVLKFGGRTAIILPSSILSNSGIYTKVREIVLKYFNLIAITELGSQTFIATGTNTVVLFMERKDDKFSIDYKRISEEIFNSYEFYDNDYLSSEEFFYKFIEYRGLEKKSYIDFVKNENIGEILLETEIFKTYKAWFDGLTEIKNIKNKKTYSNLSEEQQAEKLNILFCRKVKEIEKEKFYYFCLASEKKTIIIKSPDDNKKQKEFLGYEFNKKRGFEGIEVYTDSENNITTKLYGEEENYLKINFYIKNAFRKNNVEIADEVREYVKEINLIDMLDFEKVDFEKQIDTNADTKFDFIATFGETEYKGYKISELAVLLKRGKSPKYGDSDIQLIKSGQIRGYESFDFSEKYFSSNVENEDERVLVKGDILINSTGVGTAGRVNLFDLDGKYVVDSHVAIFRPDKLKLVPKYVLYCFDKIGFKNIEKMAKGSSGQIELAIETIANLKIPVPPKEIQERIVKEIGNIEKNESTKKYEIERLNLEVKNKIDNIFNKEKNFEKLVNVADCIQSGGTPKTDIKEYWENGNINWLRSEVCQNCYVYENQVKDKITKIGMEKSNTKIFPKDTILVALVGATLGKIGYLTFDSCTNQNIAGIYNLKNVIPKYLFYILMNFRELNEYGKGDFKMLSITKLREFKIPLPSIEEQKIIASEIEEIEKKIFYNENELINLEQLKKKVFEENL